MLHEPDRHEALRAAAWDAGPVRAAIAAIVADAVTDWNPARGWPVHPLDLEPGEDPEAPVTALYHGASGMHWALDHLAARGLARSIPFDAATLIARHRTWLGDMADREAASWLMGETPIRTMAFVAQRSAHEADALEALIAGNVDHPSRELLWGSPGTLLAALFLFERTGDARWSALFLRTASRLWHRRERSDALGCAYWTQDLYGKRRTFLGAGHGFVGTAHGLVRGRRLFDPVDWMAWKACIVETVVRTAVVEGDLANWRIELASAPDDARWFVQWCHGAPGFVIALAELADPALDALLVAAGETIWRAGPLAKGAGLCHGTGGNGYAFLKLHARTGDARWLDRARAFAMHGIDQVDEARARHGRGRYALWTGDVGFAIYLADCLEGRDAFPTLDVF